MLRQIQEKCREQNIGIYAAFVDFAKAFDTACRNELWKILVRPNCPPISFTILRQLYEGQQGQVNHKGSLSSSFPIANGVRQENVLAPTLFSSFISIMLCQATKDLQDGMSTFGVSSHARKKVGKPTTELLFADDCASLTHKTEALQHILKRRRPQESQPAQYRVHLASGAAGRAVNVTRMEGVRMPKAVFFSELQEEKRERGAPRKRYKDQLKRQLSQAGMKQQTWQQEASDRDSWRSLVRKASCEFEAERHAAAKERHRKQKERAASQSFSVRTFACPKCSRVCTSRIGLYSHHQ